MDKIELQARGKINLCLDVLGRRDDGYHDVRMVMQTVKLCDLICLEKTDKEGIEITSNLDWLPTGEKNLAWKAAHLLMEQYDIPRGIRIRMSKKIPVAAGMAGGSSDAAAVLVGMNRLFSMGLKEDELMRQGKKLGADVPYCVKRGTILAEGIGEKLTPLSPCPWCHVLLAKPRFGVSTPRVYKALDESPITHHPDTNAMIRALDGGDIRAVADVLGNVLEEVVISEYPLIGELKKMMMRGGALGALMSGSGPTVFGLFSDFSKAKNTAWKIRKSGRAGCIFLTSVYNVRRN